MKFVLLVTRTDRWDDPPPMFRAYGPFDTEAEAWAYARAADDVYMYCTLPLEEVVRA